MLEDRPQSNSPQFFSFSTNFPEELADLFVPSALFVAQTPFLSMTLLHRARCGSASLSHCLHFVNKLVIPSDQHFHCVLTVDSFKSSVSFHWPDLRQQKPSYKSLNITHNTATWYFDYSFLGRCVAVFLNLVTGSWNSNSFFVKRLVFFSPGVIYLKRLN